MKILLAIVSFLCSFSLVFCVEKFRKFAKTYSKCIKPSLTFIYRGLELFPIIETYESAPTFAITLQDLSKGVNESKLEPLKDRGGKGLILSLELKDIQRLLDGPFKFSSPLEEDIEDILNEFNSKTGFPLEYIMVPQSTPKQFIQALKSMGIYVIFRWAAINFETDLTHVFFSDFVFVDLSVKGIYTIMKLGEHIDKEGKEFFSLEECLNIASVIPEKCYRLSKDFSVKQEKVKEAFKPLHDVNILQLLLKMPREHVFSSSVALWNTFIIPNNYLEFFIGNTRIQFEGEDGSDYGGLTKEWMSLIKEKGFGNGSEYFVDVTCSETFSTPKFKQFPEAELGNFSFLGSFIAKLLISGQTTEFIFPNFLLKLMLGRKPQFHDLMQIDSVFLTNYLKMIDDPDMFEFNCATYVYNILDENNVNKVVSLVPKGDECEVTSDNVYDYLVKFFNAITSTPQIQHFVKHFLNAASTRFPLNYLSVNDFRAILSNFSDIDVEDWKANTVYGVYEPNSIQIVWFWEIVKNEMDDSQRRKLLKWVTGSSTVPLGGFAQLVNNNQEICKFKISIKYGNLENWPVSHTCFNTLDLPPYNSKTKMLGKILVAIDCDQFNIA